MSKKLETFMTYELLVSQTKHIEGAGVIKEPPMFKPIWTRCGTPSFSSPNRK